MRKLFKKITAVVAAATMVMAMGVTAFAAEDEAATLAPGTYTVKSTLYKDAACTSTSMGNQGMTDSTLTVKEDGSVVFEFKTIKFTYIGMSGYLNVMSLDGVSGDHTSYTEGDYEYHVFTFNNSLALSKFSVGNVFTGEFTMKIAGIINRDGTGYLKIDSITAN